MPALTLGNLWLYAVQAALVVTAVAATLWLLGPAPRVRLFVLRTVFFAVLALPFQAVLWPGPAGVPAAEVAPSVAFGDTLTVGTGAPAGVWRPWFTAVLVGGAVARGLWVGLGLLALVRATRHARPAGNHATVRDLQERLATRARVCWHDGIAQPVTFGLWPAVVLLPASSIDAPPPRLRVMVGHELLHVQRRDWAWVLGEELAQTLLWWHPAIWWLVSELQLAREEVIDRLTVDTLGGRRDYLEALLGVVDAPAPAPLLSMFLRRRQLARRIASLAREVSMSRPRALASTLVVTTVLVAATALVVHALPLAPMPQTVVPRGGAGQVASEVPAQRSGPRILAQTPVPFPSAGANPELEEAIIRVLATVDATGAITDTQVGGYSFRTRGGVMAQFTGVPIADSLRLLAPATPGPNVTAAQSTAMSVIRENVEALARAALDSVRQWRVQVPVQAPATVEIAIRFEPSVSRAAEAAGAAAVSGYGALDRPSTNGSPVPRSTVQTALRVGGAIGPPKKVVNANPVYPEDAKAAGVQGVVILETTIGPDGVPADVRVLRSVPGLDGAAVEAVKQWRYDPTWLNGQPVPVIMTMTIDFTLPQ